MWKLLSEPSGVGPGWEATRLEGPELSPRLSVGMGKYWRLGLEFIYESEDYDDEENRHHAHPQVSVFMDVEGEKVVGGAGVIAGLSFCEIPRARQCYSKPSAAPEAVEKAIRAAHYFIKARLPALLDETRGRALAEYSGKRIAHDDVLSSDRTKRKLSAAKMSVELLRLQPWAIVPVTADNVEAYNDLAFFADEGGFHQDANQALEQVTKAVPERAPAWLNLGDARTGLKDAEGARAAYQKYRELTEKAGGKVAARVLKLLGDAKQK